MSSRPTRHRWMPFTARAFAKMGEAAPEVCRQCGACIYVCPVCELRCTYNEPEKDICGACANLSPPCLDKEQFSDMMCYLNPCVACEVRDSETSRS